MRWSRSRKASGARWRARRARLGVLPAVGALSALAVALSGPRPDGSAIRGDGVSWRLARVTSSRTKSRFAISGSIAGLFPGQSTRLVLTVDNPQRFAIVVTSITTAVGTPRAGCRASNLTVRAFSGKLRVSARANRSTTVPITLVHAAPDACQGARFTLTYSGLAHRA